jgi:hypothetical protein
LLRCSSCGFSNLFCFAQHLPQQLMLCHWLWIDVDRREEQAFCQTCSLSKNTTERKKKTAKDTKKKRKEKKKNGKHKESQLVALVVLERYSMKHDTQKHIFQKFTQSRVNCRGMERKRNKKKKKDYRNAFLKLCFSVPGVDRYLYEVDDDANKLRDAKAPRTQAKNNRTRKNKRK